MWSVLMALGRKMIANEVEGPSDKTESFVQQIITNKISGVTEKRWTVLTFCLTSDKGWNLFSVSVSGEIFPIMNVSPMINCAPERIY